MELALAIVKEINGWLAVTIVGVVAALGVMFINRKWSRTYDKKDEREHELKMFERKTSDKRQMFELETERAVKLSIPPEVHNGPQLEHRMTDRNEDGTRGGQ